MFAEKYKNLLSTLARAFNALQPVLALLTRWWVSWQFLKSGWLKITDWEQTLGLFEVEFHVPLLSPHVAAVVGTFGELTFPTLLIFGLGGRIAPLGLLAVNVMAVVSYSDVLLAVGAEAALAQHVLWGFMLIMLTVYGQGSLALDRLITKRTSTVSTTTTI